MIPTDLRLVADAGFAAVLATTSRADLTDRARRLDELIARCPLDVAVDTGLVGQRAKVAAELGRRP